MYARLTKNNPKKNVNKEIKPYYYGIRNQFIKEEPAFMVKGFPVGMSKYKKIN